MNRTCVTHTACGHRIDVTGDNLFLDAGTDQLHDCPGPAGPWTVISTGRRFTLEFVLDPDKTQPIYPTQHAAQHEANQRNAAYERAHTPKPTQPAQGDLFNTRENTA